MTAYTRVEASALALLTLVIAVALWWQGKKKCLEESSPLVSALVICLSVVAVYWLIVGILHSVFSYWNSGRLSAAISLAKGYRLFYGPDQGPILGWMYGPLAAIAYLPASLFSSPTLAVIFATALSTLFTFGPVAFVLFLSKYHKAIGPFWRLVLLTFFFFQTFTLPSNVLWRSVHADSPALFFATVACLFALPKKKEQTSHGNITLSALFSVLAIATKQTFLTLPFAIAAHLGWYQGRHAFLRYAGLVALWSLAVGGALCLLFPPSGLWFDMVTYPMRFGWWSSLNTTQGTLLVGSQFWARVKILWEAAWELFGYCQPVLLPALALSLYLKCLSQETQSTLAHPKREPSAPILFAVVAFFLAPLCVLGRVKYGGTISSFIGTVYFLQLTLLFGLLHVMIAKGNRAANLLKETRLAKAFLLAFVLVTGAPFVTQLHRASWRLAELRDPPENVAARFARKYPGTTYFPWYPLANLMGEGKLYHWYIGIGDRKVAQMQPSPSQFRTLFPNTLQHIAFFDQSADEVLSYFPEFNEKITHPELPGWTLYRRSAPP